ncbi:peroxidase-related enzyme [Pseudorhodoferax sp.]|uniref:peroxidase-related enzyme n=1 Tax=Pseudorhodoferax sp. TaxID=1993553 RepID=UPI002DD655C7|nr:peroxidase-related enzyme [Pseudorhodoferax sp.]
MSTEPKPVCRYPVPDVVDLPEDLRDRILEVQHKAGFVPNVFLALARRPAELRAFLAYHDALLLREESGLSKAEKEMVIVATSGANRCLYCVVAHGAILRVYAKAPRLADQLATNPLKAEVTPRQAAMLAFALKVALDAQSITEADYAALREQGWDDEDAWDILSIAGLFGLSNRIANAISLMPNEEFHLMGRLPRTKG